MNMQKLGASRKPGTLSSKKSNGQKFPQALADQDAVGKRGSLHQISGWMVSLGWCGPQFGQRVLVCVLLELSAQVVWWQKEPTGNVPEHSTCPAVPPW